MSNDIFEEINDVISVLKGGAEFYREGAEEVKNPELAKLFREYAAKRDAAVIELSAEVAAHGGTPSEGSWAEKAHAWYGEAKSWFGDKEDTLIAELEEHEDRTLEEIRDALEDVPATHPAHAILTRHLGIFQQTHDHMRDLKKAA